jgi:hypothetical protein
MERKCSMEEVTCFEKSYKVGLRGWEEVLEPWTYDHREKYIELFKLVKNSLQNNIERIRSQKKHI